MAQKQEQPTAQNDVFVQSADFFTKNKKWILLALLAILLIFALIFGYTHLYKAPRENKASTELAKGQDYFNQEMFDKALNGDGATFKGFTKIASDFKGTKAANLANLYAGLCYANLEKWQEAVNYLEKFSAKGDMLISPAAIAALGNAYANTGKLDKAVSLLKEAASKADSRAKDGTSNSLAPTFLMQAGALLESQNKKDDALKLYQEMKEKYVNSAAVQLQEVDSRIERLEAK